MGTPHLQWKENHYSFVSGCEQEENPSVDQDRQIDTIQYSKLPYFSCGQNVRMQEHNKGGMLEIAVACC